MLRTLLALDHLVRPHDEDIHVRPALAIVSTEDDGCRPDFSRDGRLNESQIPATGAVEVSD